MKVIVAGGIILLFVLPVLFCLLIGLGKEQEALKWFETLERKGGGNSGR